MILTVYHGTLLKFTDTCMLELSQGLDEDAESLSIHMKAAFGKLWKEVLYEGQLVDGNADPGSPTVLTISTSALRSLDFLGTSGFIIPLIVRLKEKNE